MKIEHHKKLIDDQEEQSKKLCTSLEDMIPKLMKRDKDVKEEFIKMEKRLNCHQVAPDRAEDRIQALEEAMTLQHAKMESMLDKLCHCQLKLVNLILPHHLTIRLMGLLPRMLMLKDPLSWLQNCPMRHLSWCCLLWAPDHPKIKRIILWLKSSMSERKIPFI